MATWLSSGSRVCTIQPTPGTLFSLRYYHSKFLDFLNIFVDVFHYHAVDGFKLRMAIVVHSTVHLRSNRPTLLIHWNGFNHPIFYGSKGSDDFPFEGVRSRISSLTHLLQESQNAQQYDQPNLKTKKIVLIKNRNLCSHKHFFLKSGTLIFLLCFYGA